MALKRAWWLAKEPFFVDFSPPILARTTTERHSLQAQDAPETRAACLVSERNHRHQQRLQEGVLKVPRPGLEEEPHPG